MKLTQKPEVANPPFKLSDGVPTEEIFDPLTGELVPVTADVDDLIYLYSRLKEFVEQANVAKTLIARVLAARTNGTTKTRRIEGKVHRAKITMPSTRFSQPKLKEAWNSYPKHRDRLLSIQTINVRRRELEKVRNTTSEQPDLAQFFQMVLGAEEDPSPNPTITVER